MLKPVGVVLVFGMPMGSLEESYLNCSWTRGLLKCFVHRGYEM